MSRKLKILGIPVFDYTSNAEKRFEPSGSLADHLQNLFDAFNANASNGGVKVTTESSLALPAVWRAINVLSGTIASLPLQVFKSDANSRQQARTHDVAKLLKKPSPLMNAYMFRETMQAVLLMWGNSYAYIRRNGSGKAIELIPVHPNDVQVLKHANKLFYQIRLDNNYILVEGKDMIHLAGLGFDGLVGKSPITVMRESLGVALNAQKFGNNFFANGANISGVLEHPDKLSDDVYSRLRSSWNEKYKGIDKSHEVAILEGGMKFSRIGVPPEEAQFLQTRQFQISEVARMFGVQPHLLMDLERSTNNNIEHQGIEFVTYTLQPWISRWEAELNAKLFAGPDGEVHYVEFNLNGLLRGDSKSRGDLYRTMINIAAMNPNEVRQRENMPAYEGGDQYFIQGANVPIDKIGAFYDQKSKTNEKITE